MSPATKSSAADKTARSLRVGGARLDGLIGELVAIAGSGPLGMSLGEFQKRWLENGRLVEADIAVLASRRSHRISKRIVDPAHDGTPDVAALRKAVESISATTSERTLLSREIDELPGESAQTRDLIHRIGMALQNQSITIGELSGILHEYLMDVSHPNLAADTKLSIEVSAAEKVHRLSPQTSIALLYELEVGTQQVFKANSTVTL